MVDDEGKINVQIIKSISELDNSVVSFNHGAVETIPPVGHIHEASFNEETTEDEGFYAGPNKSTTNIGWLVGTPLVPTKSPHIDIYETGQVKPPPYLKIKEVPPIGHNLSRSKSVCDLSIEQNSQLLNSSEKSFTIERKRVIERRKSSNNESQQAHRSRVVRNRTILGSFPLFYKLSQSLSSLNTKSEASGIVAQIGSDCGAFWQDDSVSDR